MVAVLQKKGLPQRTDQKISELKFYEAANALGDLEISVRADFFPPPVFLERGPNRKPENPAS